MVLPNLKRSSHAQCFGILNKTHIFTNVRAFSHVVILCHSCLYINKQLNWTVYKCQISKHIEMYTTDHPINQSIQGGRLCTSLFPFSMISFMILSSTLVLPNIVIYSVKKFALIYFQNSACQAVTIKYNILFAKFLKVKTCFEIRIKAIVLKV